LRAAPADKVAAIAVPSASPIVDGVVIPVAPLSAFRSGEFHRVPVIVGSNRDEGTFFVSAPITTQAAYEANLAGRQQVRRILRAGICRRDGRSAHQLQQ
jgi:carboxylesterase type B